MKNYVKVDRKAEHVTRKNVFHCSVSLTAEIPLTSGKVRSVDRQVESV